MNDQGLMRAKITDFGLASLLDSKVMRVKAFQVTVNMGASLPYCPPEMLDCPAGQESKVLTDRFDIFSVGVILSELLGRQRPWQNISNMRIMEKVLRGERPINLVLQTSTHPFVQFMSPIIHQCWAQNPRDRMSASDLVRNIETYPVDTSQFLSGYQ